VRNLLNQPIASEKQGPFQRAVRDLLKQPIASEKQGPLQRAVKNLLKQPIAIEKQDPDYFQSPEIFPETQRTQKNQDNRPKECPGYPWDRDKLLRSILARETDMEWLYREGSDPQ
jgi:hypothetical protein